MASHAKNRSALISSTLPSLIGGVSQQPWSVRLPNQCEEMINCTASITEFLRRRPCTVNVAKIFDDSDDAFDSDIAIHLINRDEDERYIVVIANKEIKVFGLDGTEYDVTNNDEDYLDVDDPSTDLSFLTINDYTFIVNKDMTVEMSDDTTSSLPSSALVFIKQASYNTTYTITLEDSGTHSFTTEDGVNTTDEDVDEISSKQIASELASQIDTDYYTVSYKKSCIYIKRIDGSDFSITVDDTRSNTHTSVCKHKIQTFSDLLEVAPNGYRVEVTGDANSSFDNYYVKFQTTDGSSFGNGVWVETVAPEIPYKLDASTMPHTLIRNSDGTFTFDAATWNNRVCGDEETSPDPSFVGRTISKVFFYRNRLGFLSWENVCMSRTGDFFNFFNSTVTTMVDDDPIDVAASHTRPTNIEHCIAYTGGLLLFSDSTQFILEHDSVLANSTVSIRPITEFEADMLVAPVTSGKTVFFGTKRGEYAGIREYYTLPENADQNDAADVAAHIPWYIEGRAKKFTCSTNEDILFVQTDEDTDSIYVYKYFWNGTEKSQSCWSRWDMSGTVLGFDILNTELYLVMKYDDDGIYIEKMSIEPNHKDDGEDFEYCIDRKVDETSLTDASYDEDLKQTTFTLPYPVSDSDDLMIVTRDGDESTIATGVKLEIVSLTNNTIVVVKGNLSLSDDTVVEPLFIGVKYNSYYEFSTLARRMAGVNTTNGGAAYIDGRLQLRRLTINVSETGYLECTVSPDYRDESTYVFSGKELGHGSNVLGEIPLYTGDINIPILSKNTQVKIACHSDSYLPFSLVNATWEGFYNIRSMRK